MISQTISSNDFYKYTHTQKSVFVYWRRRRDLNPRAAFTTYTLSRGASSANLSTSPNIEKYELVKRLCAAFRDGGEAEIRTLGAFASLVFKTSSLNHSDTSPSVIVSKKTLLLYHFHKILSSLFPQNLIGSLQVCQSCYKTGGKFLI